MRSPQGEADSQAVNSMKKEFKRIKESIVKIPCIFKPIVLFYTV